MSYTALPVTTPTLITLVDASGMPFARWTLQGSAPEGRILRWKAEGNIHMAGSAMDFARSWHHRGFRLEMVIRWNVGVQSFRQDWTGTAWGDPEPLPTALAHSQILRWAARATVVVQPFEGDDSFIFNANATGDGLSLRDIGAVAHTHLEMMLEAVSLADAPAVPGTIDPEARTGWSYGAWSYYTWDSARVPGNVSAGMIAYNLKTASMGNYPSGAYTCEIQARDLRDRVNHTFATHAKMRQIIEAGYISTSDFVTAWVHVVEDVVYVYCIGPIVNNVGRSPSKTAIFRLDSIDPETKEGSFTLMREMNLNTGAGSGVMPNTAYLPGLVTLGMVGYSGLNLLASWPWNRRITSQFAHFTDYYLQDEYVDIANQAEITADIFLTPASPLRPSRVLTATQTLNYKIVTCSVRPWEPAGPSDFQVLYEASGSVTSSMGMSWTGANQYPGSALSTVNVVGSTDDLYEIDATYGGGLDPFHPAGMHTKNAHGLFRGRMYDTTRRFYFNTAMERTIWTPPTMPGNDRLMGVWGDTEAIVGIRGNTAGRDVNWNYFYVCKASDTEMANQYSIYSSLDSDGRILHLEGVEDVTPAMWLDGTKLFDLN